MKKRHYSALSIEEINEFENSYEISHEDDDIPVAFVHNIVSTTKIRSSVMPIDLKYVSVVLPNSFYDRNKFAAITIRIDNPTCTVLLFSSGKLVLTGSESWYKCIHASLNVVKMLKKYVHNVDFMVEDITVQNVVGNAVVPLKPGQTLNILRMYQEHCSLCTYQAQMFPGLIYRAHNSPVVLLCFESGKVVVTGGKSMEDIMVGWRKLWPIVKQYVE